MCLYVRVFMSFEVIFNRLHKIHFHPAILFLYDQLMIHVIVASRDYQWRLCAWVDERGFLENCFYVDVNVPFGRFYCPFFFNVLSSYCKRVFHSMLHCVVLYSCVGLYSIVLYCISWCQIVYYCVILYFMVSNCILLC